MSELMIADVRDAVRRLAIVQEEKLREHDEDRGADGWKGDDLFALWTRILDEAVELHGKISDFHLALAKHASFGAPIPKTVALAVIRECADVGNFAAMIADEAHRLAELGDSLPEAPEPEPEAKPEEEPQQETEEAPVEAKEEPEQDPEQGEDFEALMGDVLELPAPITFPACIEAALQEYGWAANPEMQCWTFERRRIAMHAVESIRAQDIEFAKKFIDLQVVQLAEGLWKRVVEAGKDKDDGKA